MMKKLTMLMAGALAALAFAALPAVATANEFNADCATGTECTATISGLATALENSRGEKVDCTSVDGTATQRNNSSTGTVELTFTGCFETTSGFKTRCNSSGAAAGTITTNTMVSHLIYLEPNASTPGVLLTGANVTFTCGLVFRKIVTGNIIGQWTDPQCGTSAASHTVNFEPGATTGTQKWTRITTTGTDFDLISETEGSGTYLTSSQEGEGTLTAENNNNATFTC